MTAQRAVLQYVYSSCDLITNKLAVVCLQMLHTHLRNKEAIVFYKGMVLVRIFMLKHLVLCLLHPTISARLKDCPD